MDHRKVAGDADEGVVAVENDINAEVRKQKDEGAQHGVGPIENVLEAALREQVLQVGPSKNRSDRKATRTRMRGRWRLLCCSTACSRGCGFGAHKRVLIWRPRATGRRNNVV